MEKPQASLSDQTMAAVADAFQSKSGQAPHEDKPRFDRLEALQDSAQRLADMVLDPHIKDPDRRRQVRAEAYEALVRHIDLLAAICATAEEYAEAILLANTPSLVAAAFPEKPPGAGESARRA
jgi:hypothetical protein